MTLLQKFKGIKKRWYLLLIVILLVGGGAAAKFHFRQYERTQEAQQAGTQTYRQVYTDLLYLENFPTLKVTPGQAKELLPLVDRVSSTSDPTLQFDVEKQIYGMLTPVQYETLLDKQAGDSKDLAGKRDLRGGPSAKNKRDYERQHDSRGREAFAKGNYRDPMEQALGTVVTKMLTERSAEKAVSPAA
ncbi:MAG: hypothetical protein ACYCVD_12640 [Desulfitobacteriaceae bacterium]